MDRRSTPVAAAQHADPDAMRPVTGRRRDRPSRGLVRRVIQHLDLEAVGGIVERCDRIDQSVDHSPLVVDGELVATAEEEWFRRVKHWTGLADRSGWCPA